MDNSTIDTVFSILKADVKPLREPIVSKVARTSDAFQVLVSTMLSLRTKDCLLYTSDAADDLLCVDLGGRRIIKKKKQIKNIEMYDVSNHTNETRT